MSYQFAKPDNGEAYTVIELNTIYQFEIHGMDYMNAMERRWEFFQHLARMPKNPDRDADKATGDLITRAILAEVQNPAVFALKDFKES